MDRHMDRHTDTQTHGQTHRHTDRHMDRHTDRHTQRWDINWTTIGIISHLLSRKSRLWYLVLLAFLSSKEDWVIENHMIQAGPIDTVISSGLILESLLSPLFQAIVGHRLACCEKVDSMRRTAQAAETGHGKNQCIPSDSGSSPTWRVQVTQYTPFLS